MKLYVFFIVLAVGLVACKSPSQKETTTQSQVATPAKSEKVVHRVDNADFAAKLTDPDAQLVDVRTPGEHAKGAIKGSVNMNYHDRDFAEQTVGKLDKNKPVLLYCAGGVRSAKAAKVLEKEGFTEIYDLEKGYSGWEK